MAQVTSYSTLATAVLAYMSRSDVGVASGNLDYLIQECEAELNARLRVRRMLTALTPTVSAAGVVTLPSDFGGWKRFQIRDGTREWDLDLLSAEETTDVWSLYGTSGIPKALVTGATAQIVPFTNGTYSFAALYYARIAALTSTNTSNWVMANFPMAYLYGCLAAARGFAKNDSPKGGSRLDVWNDKFQQAIRQIKAEDARDFDARTHKTLSPDTSLFNGGGVFNVTAGY